MAKKKFLPKLRKKLGSFAKNESGKISMQSMATVGAIVGGAAIGAALNAKVLKAAHSQVYLGERLITIATSNGEIILSESSSEDGGISGSVLRSTY